MLYEPYHVHCAQRLIAPQTTYMFLGGYVLLFLFLMGLCCI